MSLPTLPNHIKTVLITGARGYVGREVAKVLLEQYPGKLDIVLTDLEIPDALEGTTTVAADLCEKDQVQILFTKWKFDAIIAFQGIMSGGSEANFDLGFHVNVDSHRVLLEQARFEGQQRGQKILYVFSSSLAVYGGPKCRPQDYVDPETTPLFPETSYGAAKAIAELYVFDYTRKGFIDGRILRLPTVCVRTGAPSTAASSFISGLIREPLQGIPSVCPIADSFDDEAMTGTPIYVSRSSTVFRNIAYAVVMDSSKFPSHSRTVNLPGFTVTPKGIVEALEKAGGKKALDLVSYKKDPIVVKIFSAWAGAYNNKLALDLGFMQDDEKTGFFDAVQDFQKTL
ncbi:NAD(P)-binding protein [Meredithblackwellia eburnea MCA 4105]